MTQIPDADRGDAAARRQQPAQLLTPALLHSFGDAGKWARPSGIAMIVIGTLVAIAALIISIEKEQAPLGVISLAAGATFAIAGASLYAYGKRVTRALGEEPALNIEIAFGDVRRFWTAMTLFTALVIVAEMLFRVGPPIKAALVRSKLNQTSASMAIVRDGLEAYAAKHHRYPEAKNYAGLLPLLQPLTRTKLPRTDAWGTELKYVVTCQETFCYEYRLISAGSDRKLETGRAGYERAIDPAAENGDDVILVNGRFLHGPREWIGK